MLVSRILTNVGPCPALAKVERFCYQSSFQLSRAESPILYYSRRPMALGLIMHETQRLFSISWWYSTKGPRLGEAASFSVGSPGSGSSITNDHSWLLLHALPALRHLQVPSHHSP